MLRFDSGVASTVLEKMPEEDGERKAKLSSCTAVVTSIEGKCFDVVLSVKPEILLDKDAQFS